MAETIYHYIICQIIFMAETLYQGSPCPSVSSVSMLSSVWPKTKPRLPSWSFLNVHVNASSVSWSISVWVWSGDMYPLPVGGQDMFCSSALRRLATSFTCVSMRTCVSIHAQERAQTCMHAHTKSCSRASANMHACAHKIMLKSVREHACMRTRKKRAQTCMHDEIMLIYI